MKKLEGTIKIAKSENADLENEAAFLTFKKWEKNGKCRIYINDYKGRTIGYIDHKNNDEAVINDRQGNYQAEIDFAIEAFKRNYEI